MHLVRACNYSIQGGSMRIAGSRIAFQATHQEVQRHEEKLSVRFWKDGENSTARKEPLDRVELSRQGKEKCSCAEQQRIDEANEALDSLDQEVRFIKLLLEAWLGRKIDLPDPVTTDVEAHEPIPIPTEEQVREEMERVGWGLEINYSET